MTNQSNIEVLDTPLKTNFGQWAIDHPECDTIYERTDTGSVVLIYAYARKKDGNKELETYRDRYFADKKIMAGLTADGVRSIL